MSECVAELLHLDSSRTYGKDDEANELADQIMVEIADQVSFDAVYPRSLAAASPCTHRLAFLRPAGRYPRCLASRLATSLQISTTIPPQRSAHRFFKCGRSGIFPAEPTAERNPDAVVDVVKAAFSIDDKYLSFYSSEGDLSAHGFLASLRMNSSSPATLSSRTPLTTAYHRPTTLASAGSR